MCAMPVTLAVPRSDQTNQGSYKYSNAVLAYTCKQGYFDLDRMTLPIYICGSPDRN